MNHKQHDLSDLMPGGPGSETKKNSWLTSFLDLFMLLLAFFLILGSMAVDEDLFMDFSEGTGFRSITQGTEPVLTPIWDLKYDMEKELEEELALGRVRITPEHNELRLQFVDGQFYETASAELLPGGKEIIDRLMSTLDSLQFYSYHIDVEGHTDDRPIATDRYPSNWELSTARASNVIRYFISQGFPPERMKASGYAEMHPLVSNRDEYGNPLPHNMALNRRIVMRIYYELGDIVP